MEDEKKYLQEYQKLDDETRKLIKKYNDDIYENKISDGKEDLLYQICKKLENQGSSLKEYFEKEIFVCGTLHIMGYFYSEELIKENISNDYISWYIFRESQVRHNFLLRGKYCWIIFCLDKSKYDYAKKLSRYCKYIILIYVGSDWISTQYLLPRQLIVECIKTALECVHYFNDKKRNESLLNYAILLLKHISSD